MYYIELCISLLLNTRSDSLISVVLETGYKKAKHYYFEDIANIYMGKLVTIFDPNEFFLLLLFSLTV